MTSFDAIVIGGGHNGLVCAALLAKGGRNVLMLEADAEVGGAGRTEEFFPGFRASTAHLLNQLQPEVVRALDLEELGLTVSRSAFAPTVTLSRDGNPLTLYGGYGETLTGASAAEQAAWKNLRAQLLRYAGVLKPFLSRRPPELGGGSFGDMAALGQAALAVKRLGKEDMRDFLRVLLMNVYDLLDEQLTDDRLKGLLAFDAVLGSHLGPRSPTSLLGLYYRLTGEIGGGPGGPKDPKGGKCARETPKNAPAHKKRDEISPRPPHP
ncbi:MAG: phytoene desaturase family protein, partial [Mesorhizobium sp.]